MKKQYLSKMALAALAFVFCVHTADAQLGNLKNKVKNATGNIGNGNNNNSSSSSGSSSGTTNTSSSATTNDNSTPANVNISAGDSGDDLAAKGDKEFDAGKYKEALAYYNEATNRGYNDGMMRMKMNQCESEINKTPEQKAQEEQQLKDAMAQYETIKDMKYKADPVTDQGILNDFHKSNIGKIVFSKTEIPKTETSAAGFASSFSTSDNIYSRVYLSRSLTNEGNSIGLIGQPNAYRYRYTVNGKDFDAEYAKGTFQVPYEREASDTWTTFQLAMTPKVEEVKDYSGFELKAFFKKVYSLAPGTYKIKIELIMDIPEDEAVTEYRSEDNARKWTTKFGPERLLAAGEFSLTVTDAGKTAIGKKICPKFDYLNNHVQQVPDAFAMVDKSKRENETILKVVLRDNDWTYVKNGWGIILSRWITGTAIIQDKTSKLCWSVTLKFSQENTSSGGTGYGKTYFSREGETDYFLKECMNQ